MHFCATLIVFFSWKFCLLIIKNVFTIQISLKQDSESNNKIYYLFLWCFNVAFPLMFFIDNKMFFFYLKTFETLKTCRCLENSNDIAITNVLFSVLLNLQACWNITNAFTNCIFTAITRQFCFICYEMLRTMCSEVFLMWITAFDKCSSSRCARFQILSR